MPDEKSVYKILKRSIRFRKFDFKFIPIYNNEKKRFTKAELQIRIIDSKFGVIEPNVFLKVAEEYGLIYEIGLILIENACKHIEILTKENIDFESISINISLMQLEDKKFYCDLGEILAKYRVNPSKLIIEIKEIEHVKGEEKLKNIISDLSTYGIKFGIGNLGGGYILLDKIIEIPLEYIKVDKRMVLISENNKKAKIILEHFFVLAKEIELDLICEGIEKKEHKDMLTEVGCNYMQGSYFGGEVNFIKLQRCF